MMLNWFLDFRISGRQRRAPCSGRPIGRAAMRRAAAGGGGSNGDGTVQEERAAKSGPMLRGPERRFFRSSALAVSIPGMARKPPRFT